MTEVLRVSTLNLKQIVDLTDRVNSVIREAKIEKGLCALYVTHGPSLTLPVLAGKLILAG